MTIANFYTVSSLLFTIHAKSEATHISKSAPIYTSHSLVPGNLLLACLVLGAGLIYYATLDTGLQPHELHGGDLITHQYAQVQARPGNAPGYPIYTMGGWLWFHSIRGLISLAGLSHPNPIPILSAYSMLWALVSLILFYLVLTEILAECDACRARPLTAFLTSIFLSITYFFWYYATTTEQYSSAIAHSLAIFLVYLRWRKGPPISPKLWLLAFLCGLTLAHMLTVAFLVPPLLLVVLQQHPRLLRSPKAVIGSLFAGALPLLSYWYVWLRGATHPEWWGDGSWSNAQRWFWSFLSTSQGRDELMRSFEPGRPFFGNGFPELVWQELSLPFLALGLIGLWFLEFRTRWLLMLTLLIYAIFCWFYRFGNWFQVILPAYPLILVGVALSISKLSGQFIDRIRPLVVVLWSVPPWKATRQETWPEVPSQASGPIGIDSQHRQLSRWAVHGLVFLFLGAAILWRLEQSWPAADSRSRQEDTALLHAAILLDQPLPANRGLFATVDNSLALDYLIDIWQVRSDVATIDSPTAAQLLREGETVLTTWPAYPTLSAERPEELTMLGLPFSPDWIALSRNLNGNLSVQLPPAQNRIEVRHELLSGITLIDLAVRPAPDGFPVHHGDTLAIDVTLRWQVTQRQWPSNLSISVRPTRDGTVIPHQGGIIQQDHKMPAQVLFSPASLNIPELLLDPYRIGLSAHAPDIINTISVVLYQEQDGQFEDVIQVDVPIVLHRQ